MLADGILDVDVTACHCCRYHVRPRLDTIGDDGIVRRRKSRYAVDLDTVRPGAADVRPHDVQIVREVNNLGLHRRIFENCLPLGAGRGHHDVLRRSDTREVKVNIRALQPVRCTRMDCALCDVNLRAKCLKALEMQVDGTRADRTAAGERYLRTSLARKQRSHDEEGSAHLAHELIGG